ncbi:unnamed protein product [Vitrella brassicaformis CCMP3155]|uniref:Uncharacterized protein n=2 Tax=Vitrella brassicaformis TaxID=1169539 RepID=A0A0G4EXK9_VITBC|nr:unnamed protein product [Vitrella brassicaformis CCMP3155]|mmetsp:Transcript_4325/g.9872  ORF Transcript_4325/g.9872 Transcript_4325/m.9872 type:complete len:291 (+) Transcript_4325:315-1187(+)|eukprot:CEM03952.1 unnamed protein product [Vitrella brassicaformis CCMP3155]
MASLLSSRPRLSSSVLPTAAVLLSTILTLADAHEGRRLRGFSSDDPMDSWKVWLLVGALVEIILVHVVYPGVLRCRNIWLDYSRERRINPTPTVTPPSSGVWRGTEEGKILETSESVEKDETAPIKYLLTFGHDGTVTGRGDDGAAAEFKIEGFYNMATGLVSWCETREGRCGSRRVDLTGAFDAARKSISGRLTTYKLWRNTITIHFDGQESTHDEESGEASTSPPAPTAADVAAGDGAASHGRSEGSDQWWLRQDGVLVEVEQARPPVPNNQPVTCSDTPMVVTRFAA